MTDDNVFTVPTNDQPLTPTRVRALGDTLKIHFRMKRGGGIDMAAVATLVERFAVEIERRDRSQAADRAAAQQAIAKLKEWQEGYVEEHGVVRRPSPLEVTAVMGAQLQADRELAVARGEAARVGIPQPPEPAADPLDAVLARARWLSNALPAAKEHTDALRAALPAAEHQEVELRRESDRFAHVLPMASAALPGATLEVTEASSQVAS